jgi:DNA-3-methyladenine glycosylase II
MAALLTRKRLTEGTLYLTSRDGDLARLFAADGVPPLWARKPCFSTLIRIILEQQVSLASAMAVYRRLLDSLVPFTPARFMKAGSSHLRSLGVTRQKASYCIHLADAVLGNRLDLNTLSGMDDPAVVGALTQIKGIGPWTAHIYLLMALRRPDVWPSGDVALINTLRKVKSLAVNPSPSQLFAITETWRPFRSVAARMLWHHYLSNKSKADPMKRKTS